MTTPVPFDDVFASLAALERGDGSVRELEAALEQALPPGTEVPDEARTRMRDAAEAGLVPKATMLRFGIGAAAPQPVPQPASQAPPAGATVLRASPGRAVSADPAPDPFPAAPSATSSSLPSADPLALLAPLPAATGPAPTPSTSTGWRATTIPNRGDVSATDDVEPGMLLDGRYRLERQLGEGGMGVVFAAADLEMSGETCAVKILKPEIRDDEAARALLRQEVAQARKFPHPNIASVFSMEADPVGNLYIVMEYLQGKPLDALIADDFGRGMPFERAWPLIRDVGQALSFVHSKSVVHSDLKPSNIFVTTSGIPKLLDFGIARVSRGRKVGVDGGDFGALTVEYASCEMWDRETHKPEARDDIYSFGCVVYELLSGRHPFDGMDSVSARNAGRRVPPLVGLSASQNAALAAALAFDRDSRTASVDALLAGLAPGAAAAAPRARGTSGARLPIGIAVTVLLIGALLGWFWLQSRHPAPTPGTTGGAGSNLLSGPRALAEQARTLDVDPADPRVVQGLQQMRDAEGQIAAGDLASAATTATAAEAALQQALQSSPRVAHLGSTADEVALALELCKRAGQHCTAEDFADESPSAVMLAPFELDPAEVTNAEFERFATEKHYQTAAEQGPGVYRFADGRLLLEPHQSWKTLRTRDLPAGADPGAYPVRGIDFASAAAYCAWAGKRLPSGAEWEFIARPDHRLFAWGNDATRAGATAPGAWVPAAEQAATGRFGVRGLGGALWEWTDDASGSDRALRGAPWTDHDPMHQRLALHAFEAPTRAHADAGVRCARTVPAWPGVAAAHP